MKTNNKDLASDKKDKIDEKESMQRNKDWVGQEKLLKVFKYSIFNELKASTLICTAICIFGVDFHDFPRRVSLK